MTRRWMALVNLLKSDKAMPGSYANALLRKALIAALAEANRYIANNRPRLARMVVAWEQAYKVSNACSSSLTEPPLLKHVRFDVELDKVQPAL